MARPPSKQPTEGELEILKVLWDEGPAELRRVCTALRRHRPVATTTVATMLKLMHEKGLLDRADGARGSLWSAKVSRDAASAGLIGRLVDLVFDGSARQLVAHLVVAGKLGAEDRKEIRRLLDEHGPAAEEGRRKRGGSRR